LTAVVKPEKHLKKNGIGFVPGIFQEIHPGMKYLIKNQK
jgi:hypothetical protein